MGARPRSEYAKQQRHRRLVIAGLVLLLAAFAVVVVLVQRSPATTVLARDTVLLHSITVLNILLLLVLLFVLGRNLTKLYVERRRRKLGSRFSTKVVVTYIGMALVPCVLLFLVASELIQRSLTLWFSPTTTQIVSHAREVARQSALDQEQQLLVAARDLSATITQQDLLAPDARERLERRLAARRSTLMLDAVSVYASEGLLFPPVVDTEGVVAVTNATGVNGDGITELQANLREALEVPRSHITLALNGQEFRLQPRLQDGLVLVQAGVPIYASDAEEIVGGVVAHRRLASGLARQADAIDALYRSYVQGVDQQGPITDAYLLTFLLMTLLILFSSLWVGLYLARGVAVPIQKLAEGTREVASGNLNYQVEVQGRDELGTLVESFNQMTRDLRAGQDKLQQSRDSLQLTNLELDERRRYMEAVLANIATGVISMNADGQVTTLNRATERMLSVEAENSIGRQYEEVLNGSSFSELRELMDRAKTRRAPLEQELEVEANGSSLTVAAHCSSLRDGGGAYLGTVVVLDDLTDLIMAQKASAWREVARRIAHEIRNPLTPIQLSAQRIARRYRRAVGAEGQYEVIEEGTRTILQEVDTLKGLVSEFSRYARMPSVNLVAADLHEILEASLRSCTSMHDGIVVDREFSPEVPILKADPDQLKRAFTNLFDNAIEAMEGKGRLSVKTSFDPDVEIARIEVRDSGPGISPEDKQRLFLPYFSKKRDGTGLGLAIVHQIIADHKGYVRVADNDPQGTVFIFELPR